MKKFLSLFKSQKKKYKKDEELQEILDKLEGFSKTDRPVEIYTRLDSSTSLDDFQDTLRDYMGKKEAEQMRKTLYPKMFKERYSFGKIQSLYSDLKKQRIPPDFINDIRNDVESGKKQKVHRKLIKALGQFKGVELFKIYQNEIIEVNNLPYEDAVKIREQNGLSLYKYPQTLVYEAQKNQARTIIVFGETGSGKSTFLNAIVNYLAMVDMEDPFRYQIVVQKSEKSWQSMTKNITFYYAKNIRTNQVFRIIDTPGFGDTNGIEEDNKNIMNIKKMFQTQIDEIHCILFVMKSSTNRITQFQQYIFHCVMDLFGKDIANNFSFVFTFSDSGNPSILDSLMDSKIGFGQYWHKMASPQYISVNNCGIFNKINSQSVDSIKQSYWNVGMKSIEKLFEKIGQLQPNSLMMTKEMLKKKEALSIRLTRTRQLLQISLTKKQELESYIKSLASYSEQINNNKGFEYERETTQFYSVPAKGNVTRCQTCMNTNCHALCMIGEGQTKSNCAVMDKNGNCTVCQKKCSYMNHYNSKELRKTRIVKVKETNEILRQRYNIATKEKNVAERAIQNIVKDLDERILITAENAKNILALEAQLNEISMTKRKQETVVEYLKYLIVEERRHKKKGWEKKVESYQDVIKEYNLIESYTKGDKLKTEAKGMINQVEKIKNEEGNRNASQIWDDMLLEEVRFDRNQRIIRNVNENVWNQIKGSLKKNQ